MRSGLWHPLLAVVLIGTFTGSCSGKGPTRPPTNRDPAISSVVVLPLTVGLLDSAIVTCNATDLDGDTLVYDWETDTRLRINGRPSGYPLKSNTLNSAERFYPDYQPPQLDTVWVAVTARDRRGGAAIRVITFTVHP